MSGNLAIGLKNGGLALLGALVVVELLVVVDSGKMAVDRKSVCRERV